MRFPEYITNIIQDGSDRAYQLARSIKLKDVLIPMRTFYKNALKIEFASQNNIDDEKANELINKFAPASILSENGEPIMIDALYTSEYAPIYEPLGNLSKPFADMSMHEKAMFTDELVDRISPYVHNAFTQKEIQRIDDDDNISVLLNESFCNATMVPMNNIARVTCATMCAQLPNILYMYIEGTIPAQEIYQQLMLSPDDYTTVYQIDYTNRKPIYGIVNREYGLDFVAAGFISNHIVKSIHNRLKIIFMP